MPFARVGAMPQPAPNKQRNMQRNGGDGSVGSRQKGITMEDLKKQTAIRLAQEQQQQQQQPVRYNNGGVDQNRDPPLRALSEHQIHGYPRPNYPQPPQANSYPNHTSHPNQPAFHVFKNYQQQHQQPYRQQQYHPQQQNVDYHSGSRENFRGPHTGQFTEIQQTYPRNHNANYSNQISHSQADRSVNTSNLSPSDNRHPHDQAHRFHRSNVPVNQGLRHGPPGIETQHQHMPISGVGTSKLPHGLTVHELKEMTKARLQAEAMLDRQEPDGHRDLPTVNRRFSPLDFESVPDARDRAMSRDSTSRTNHNLNPDQIIASESIRSIPSLVHVEQGNRDISVGRQPQVSPLPPGFLNFASANQNVPVDMSHQRASIPVRENWTNQQRLETWETSSAASHNSTVLSENLGSESAFSSGLGGGMNLQGEVDMRGPYPRSRSYTYPAVLHQSAQEFSYNDEKPPSVSANSSPGGGIPYFVPAIGSNRRRACTMSPKPGSIHEDRPHFSGADLTIPSFSSAEAGSFLPRSRKNTYSPVLSQLGLDVTSAGGGFFVGIDDTNRQRTSSVTSLPQLSRTSEDFSMDHLSAFSELSIGANQHQASAINRERARSADIYREQHGANFSVSAPPGFNNNIRINADIGPSSSFDHYTAFTPLGNGRTADITTADTAGDIFGSIGIGGHDMGSILKLSGVGDRPDRERSNTYPSTSQTSTEAFFTENFLGKSSGPSIY